MKRMPNTAVAAALAVLLLAVCTGGCGSRGRASAASSGQDRRLQDRKAVVVYYFHPAIRCRECIMAEAMTAQVLETEFASELAAGTVVWTPVNLDEAGGDVFRTEYGVYGSTLVIAGNTDGREGEKKTLERIWELLGDPKAFHEYVADQVRRSLRDD